MSEYKQIIRQHDVAYMKDSGDGFKFIAKKNIPANVYELLGPDKVVDDSNLPASAPVRECIFCGELATRSKFVDLQTLALCDEHYFNKTTGEIVQQLRSLSDEDQTTGQGNSESSRTEANDGQLQENPES